MRVMSKHNTTNRNYNLHEYYRISSLITIVFIITVSIIISFFFSSVSAFQQAKEYVFVKKWGSEGTADGQFQRPHDLDFDAAEKYLYTLDRDGARVQVFDKNGAFINKWGSEGTGDGQFDTPYGVDVDSQGNVWVADRNNHRIQKFDSNGNFLLKFGSEGSGDGQFSHVEHIAVDKYDNIYVTDPQADETGSGQPRVQKFDTNGNFITKWGSKGTAQLTDPEHLAIGSDGYVYISDRGSNDIKVFRPIDTVPHQ